MSAHEIDIVKTLLGGIAILLLCGAGRGNCRGWLVQRRNRDLMGLPLSYDEMQKKKPGSKTINEVSAARAVWEGV